MTLYKISLDIIDAFTIDFLRNFGQGVSSIREIINPALAVYTLNHYEYGGLGTIWLRKIEDQLTDISSTYPPAPGFGENLYMAPNFASWVLSNHPIYANELDFNAINDPVKSRHLLELYQEWLYIQRREFEEKLLTDYFAQVNQDHEYRVPDNNADEIDAKGSDNQLNLTPENNEALHVFVAKPAGRHPKKGYEAAFKLILQDKSYREAYDFCKVNYPDEHNKLQLKNWGDPFDSFRSGMNYRMRKLRR